MAKSNINWTLQGKPVKPTTLKAELIESYEYELFQTVGALVQELDDLINRLDRRTTRRGEGFLAVRYNKPFDGLFTEVKETRKGGFKVFVPIHQKGDGGYIFNLLDQGRPPILKPKDGNPMTFPTYDGTLTKGSGNTSVLNRRNVVSPSKADNAPDWVSTYSVKEVTPRKFFEAILKKRQAKKSPIKLKGSIAAKLGIPKVPKFKWEPGTVEIKITRNGK